MKNLKKFKKFITENMDSYSMDLNKDLSDNFGEWQSGHDTKEDSDELYNILRGRHNLEKPEYVRQVVNDWIGYTPQVVVQ